MSSEHAPQLRTRMIVIGAMFTALLVLTSAGSLFFVGRQTHILTRAMEAQVWHSITQRGNDISLVFVQHPHLRPYFYDSKSIEKGDPNFDAVMSVAELYLDYIDSMLEDFVFSLDGMEESGEFRTLWDAYFRDMFSSSPALRAYAVEKRHWYYRDTFAPYTQTQN
jgi:hypothetical protein